MRYSDAHCDYLSCFKKHPHQSNLTLYKKSEILIQVFAIFVDLEKKYSVLDGLSQLFRYFVMRLNKTVFTRTFNLNRINDKKNRIYPILALEGVSCLGGSHFLLKLYILAGVKSIMLTWNEENAYAGGALSRGNLTKKGENILDIMYDNNIILDVSHLNEPSFYQTIDYYKGRIMASHSCCDVICKHKRNLSDQQIDLILQKKGFIGINFFPTFLTGQGLHANSDDIVSHISHIRDLGGINNVGLGSDFSGIDETPTDMKDCTTFNRVFDSLKRHQYDDAQITKICYKNFYDFYFNKFNE